MALIYKIQLIVIFIFLINKKSVANEIVYCLQSKTIQNELKLNYTIAYNLEVVQISFDGKENNEGSLQIRDKNNRIILFTESVELIPSPNYFTVDVSEFEEGSYTFEIKTKTSLYTSTIYIK